MFLNAQLLELYKLRSSGVQLELPTGVVHPAILAWTDNHGHETQPGDGLVSLGATPIARVRGDLHHRLNFGAARHNAPQHDQLPDGGGFDLSYRNRL